MNFKRTVITMLTMLLIVSSVPMELFAAGSVTTEISSIAKDTSGNRYTAVINSGKGTRSYNVFSQTGSKKNNKSFIALHGCAASSLTCVLSGYTKKYDSWTPAMVSKQLEKKVFGTRAWRKNYTKSMMKQRPVSLYGISKILTYCKIPNKYVRFFKDKQAVKDIKKHLKTGNAVIIETNNHRQTNGKFSSKVDTRWASSKHTMALLGMTDTGKVIVADSAYRKWSGKKQRIKYADMEELVHYMIPCKRYSRTLYFNSVDTCGGYILVNKK